MRTALRVLVGVCLLASVTAGCRHRQASVAESAPLTVPQPVERRDGPWIERAGHSPRTLKLPDYIIRPGDALDIRVWDNKDLSMKMPVRPDGKISYQLAGELQVAGKTVPDVERMLREALSDIIIVPQVSVVVTDFAGKKVMVLGEVGKPGQYSYTGLSNLVEIIGKAGGYTNSASFEDVTVTRVNGDVVHTDLNQLIVRGDYRYNVLIKAGDTVFISPAKRAFVLGDVRSPGAYSLGRTGRSDVFQMVLKAGGPKDSAKTGAVRRIRKVHSDKPQVVTVNLMRSTEGLDEKVEVRHGDVIYVPRSTLAKMGNLLAALDTTLGVIATGQGILYATNFQRWAKQGQAWAENAEERAVGSEERAVAAEGRAEVQHVWGEELLELNRESAEFLRQRMVWEEERFEVWESEN